MQQSSKCRRCDSNSVELAVYIFDVLTPDTHFSLHPSDTTSCQLCSKKVASTPGTTLLRVIMASVSSGALSPSLKFRSITPITGSFAPRAGVLSLERDIPSPFTHTEMAPNLALWDLPTPGFFINTSRGVIPHLSWDHVRKMNAIGWVHVPFETLSVLSCLVLRLVRYPQEHGLTLASQAALNRLHQSRPWFQQIAPYIRSLGCRTRGILYLSH